MSYKIAMIGAGSGFTGGITQGLCRAEVFAGSRLVLMDTDPRRLDASLARQQRLVDRHHGRIELTATTNLAEALEGCDHVVTACEKKRVAYWRKDLEIPARYGVVQLKGENGGPGGQAHAMRNITMFMDICAAMREVCPDAWLMNFTNPMSFLCTYFRRDAGVKALGFCHQVHGSMGVIAEMLGMEPGELEVISGGINHLNFLVDIRRRGTGQSCMTEFLDKVRRSTYWKRNRPRVPQQVFTRDFLETFGIYPIGYDDHIVEYLPFFYPPERWQRLGFESEADRLRRKAGAKARKTLAREEYGRRYPFPKDGNHPYYDEKPTAVMEAFATNTPLYLTSMVVVNHGAIDNLPAEAVVDIPAVAVGGAVRGVHVGPLPAFAAEICRRQIAIHEMIAEATVHGDRQGVVQAMALDPYVRDIRQAEKITDAFLRYYKAELPQFHR